MIPSDPEELKLAEPFIAQFRTFTEKTIEAQILAGENKNDEAYELSLSEVKESRQTTNKLGEELNNLNQEIAGDLKKENQASAAQANVISLSISALSIIIFIGLGFLISRMITKPVRDMQSLMSQAENGRNRLIRRILVRNGS